MEKLEDSPVSLKSRDTLLSTLGEFSSDTFNSPRPRNFALAFRTSRALTSLLSNLQRVLNRSY